MNFILSLCDTAYSFTLDAFKKILKIIVVWNIVFFFPIFLVLYRIQASRIVINKILLFVQLDHIRHKIITKLESYRSAATRLIKVITRSNKKYPFGYAMLKENGRYIEPDSSNIFQYQLYDYLARKFLYLQTLNKKNVLEIECGDTGAIEFIANKLNPQVCYAVHQDSKFIAKLSKNNTSKRVQYQSNKIQELSNQFQENFFDVIIGISALNSQSMIDKLRCMKKLLKKEGYIAIGEHLQNDSIRMFELAICNAGFKISKSENISKNIVHASKIELKRQKQQSYTLEKLRARISEYIYDSRSNLVSELQSTHKFIVYILEHA